MSTASPTTDQESGAPQRFGPHPAVFAAAVALLLALSLWRAGAPNFWNDEIISIETAQRSWYGLVRAALQDLVHTPVFYGLLKVWTRVAGDSALSMRLLTIAFAVLSLFPAALLCKELSLSRRASAIALAVAATSGFLIYYAQELRPYSVLLFAAAWSLWSFARVSLRPEPRLADWILFAAAQVLLGVVHYYGWLFIGTEGLYLLITRPRRVVRFIAATLPAVAAFVPWAALILRRLASGRTLERNLAGLSVPGPAQAFGFFAGLVGPGRAVLPTSQLVTGIAVFLVPGLWVTVRALAEPPAEAGDRSGPRRSALFLASFAFVPPLIVLLVSWFLKPVFHPRYLIGSLYPFVLLWSVALDWIRPHGLSRALTAAGLLWAVYGSVDRVVRPDRVPWGDIVARMLTPDCAPDSPRPGTVYVLGRATRRPVRYYLRRLRSDASVIVIQDLSELPRGSGWLASCSGAFHERTGPRRWEGGGAAFWRAIPAGAARDAVVRAGDRVVCEIVSGTSDQSGRAISFVPVP